MVIFYRLLVGLGLIIVSITISKAQNNLVISGPLSSTPGADNVYIGSSFSNPSFNRGKSNVYIGVGAGTVSNGSNNTYIGYIAGLRAYDGVDNVYMGYWAGYSLNGNQNVAIGRYAGFGGGLYADVTQSRGSYNVYLGASAGYKGYPNGTDHNVMIGDSTGYNNVALGNVMMGSKAGFTNQTGKLNTYLGYQTGYNAVADSNTFVGYQSGYSVTTGKSNTLFGALSGQGVSTGSRNTIMGNKAGPASGNGDDNVYMGYTSGANDNGSRNTFLGTGADALAQNLTNATAIGAGAVVAMSDAVVLGKDANIGIGTSAPTARLHIRSERANDSGIRLENLTNTSPVAFKTDKVLTVNERGEVLLAQPTMGKLIVKNQDDWADRVFEPGYALKSLEEVNKYVKVNRHLPDMPSAAEVVKEGYDAATMDAHLLQKVEETMLYVIQLKQEMSQLRKENQQLKRALHRTKKH